MNASWDKILRIFSKLLKKLDFPDPNRPPIEVSTGEIYHCRRHYLSQEAQVGLDDRMEVARYSQVASVCVTIT
jgi:hypothetical protein